MVHWVFRLRMTWLLFLKIAPFDARFASQIRIHKNLKETRLPTDSCLNNSVRCTHTGWSWYRRYLLSPAVTIAHPVGCKSYRQNQTWRQSVHKISRCILPLRGTLPLLCLLQLLSWSVHREKCPNVSTIHWFTQHAHPSWCSRSTLTTVCFRCSCFSPGFCVHIGFATPSPNPS